MSDPDTNELATRTLALMQAILKAIENAEAAPRANGVTSGPAQSGTYTSSWFLPARKFVYSVQTMTWKSYP